MIHFYFVSLLQLGLEKGQQSGKAFLRPANKYVSLVLRIKDCKNRNFLFTEFVMITSSANCEGFVFFFNQGILIIFHTFLITSVNVFLSVSKFTSTEISSCNLFQRKNLRRFNFRCVGFAE